MAQGQERDFMLKLYSGPDCQCEKCGETGASTQYNPALTRAQLAYLNFAPQPEPYLHPEFLARVCRNCGFQWFEEVRQVSDA